MIENKLKFMLKNNKLDGLINNKSEAEKLCKLGTTEEVLDLLNKYNYNETKEIFERELLEILQEINLTEEELNKVTGGRISHRQAIAKFLGVVSLAGSINMPTTMAEKAAPASAVAEKKDKNSDWMSHPKEDKLAKTLAGILSVGGIVGIGSLLLYGGKKLFGLSGNEIKHEESDRSTATSVPEGMPNDQLAELASLKAPDEQWNDNLTKIDQVVVSLIKSPEQTYTDLVKDISSEDLETYAKKGLELWCKNTKKHYDKSTRSITNADTWNANFGLLVKARWAVWLLLIKDTKVTNKRLQEYVQTRFFKKEACSALGDSPAWRENAKDVIALKPLFEYKLLIVPWLEPNYSPGSSNVLFALLSLHGDLPPESSPGKYTQLQRAMEKIADNALPNCVSYIQND